MAFELPRLPPGEIPPERLQIYWQQLVEATESALNNIQSAFDALADAVAAIAAAQAAADAANAAAAAADTAATNAQTAADDVTEESALANSYVSGATLTGTDAGTDATVTISAHTRHYPQPGGGTTDVAVSGGSVTALAYDTIYYIYYDDPARAGGAVTYAATTSTATAAQTGSRHVVGAVRTPVAAAPPTGGASTDPPGSGSIDRSTL